MEDRWRHWIAKCVVGENPRDYMLWVLSEKRYSENEILNQIEAAEQNPYIDGAREVMNRKLANV